jgi:hypothetical protein
MSLKGTSSPFTIGRMQQRNMAFQLFTIRLSIRLLAQAGTVRQ